MRIDRKIIQLASLLEAPRSIGYLLSWPRFSYTSFLMVSRIVKQGILPRTVIDVGANAGQFTIASANLFADVVVHSFEPNPQVSKQLQGNVSRLPNVIVYPIALGDQTGSAEFRVNTYSQSSSVLSLSEVHKTTFPSAREKETIRVSISTLDDALSHKELTPPTLLKVDVQGYERKVLAGAHRTLNRVDYIIVETSFQPMYDGEVLFRDILRILEEQGFRFLRPLDFATVPATGEVIQMDALFARDLSCSEQSGSIRGNQ